MRRYEAHLKGYFYCFTLWCQNSHNNRCRCSTVFHILKYWNTDSSTNPAGEGRRRDVAVHVCAHARANTKRLLNGASSSRGLTNAGERWLQSTLRPKGDTSKVLQQGPWRGGGANTFNSLTRSGLSLPRLLFLVKPSPNLNPGRGWHTWRQRKGD